WYVRRQGWAVRTNHRTLDGRAGNAALRHLASLLPDELMLRGRHKVVHRTADEFCPAFRPLQSDQLKARWIHIDEPVVHRHGDAFGEEFHDRSISFLTFAQSLLGPLALRYVVHDAQQVAATA